MKIEPIEKNLPHEVSELICLKCHRRWIGAYPEKTWLKDLHCKCGAVGCVIKTGQTLPESEDTAWMPLPNTHKEESEE